MTSFAVYFSGDAPAATPSSTSGSGLYVFYFPISRARRGVTSFGRSPTTGSWIALTPAAPAGHTDVLFITRHHRRDPRSLRRPSSPTCGIGSSACPPPHRRRAHRRAHRTAQPGGLPRGPRARARASQTRRPTAACWSSTSTASSASTSATASPPATGRAERSRCWTSTHADRRRRALGGRGVRGRAARDRPAPRLPLRRGAAGPVREAFAAPDRAHRLDRRRLLPEHGTTSRA